ncbi:MULTISPECIES: hypothetical protein [unclassified Dysgonomonas]|uniref:hypothetical protein n=1 Tax=unclassified Dysgonomonas TaxID=2630389 RepID=UPI0024744154|nr:MULTISPECIES: hypothetical protein [unclassified Dysgonomonas]
MFILICVTFTALSTHSQVTIGKDVPPHEGAALEIVSNSNKGLLLPRLFLVSATAWNPPMTSSSSVDGMTVYNTNSTPENGLDGVGVYTWVNNRWYKLDNQDCPVPARPGSISISDNGPFDQGDKFTASVAAVSGATSYIWELADGLMGFSTTNQISITAVFDGNYPAGSIKVRAVNSCGISEEQSFATALIVNYVNPCVECEKPGTLDKIIFTYYVVNNDDPVSINRTDQMRAEVTPVSGADFYYWVLPNGLSGYSTSSVITITGDVAGTYAKGTIKVYAVNDCGYSMITNDQQSILVRCPEPGTINSRNIRIYPKQVIVGGEAILVVPTARYATSYKYDLTSLGITPIVSSSSIFYPFNIPSNLPEGTYAINVTPVNDCAEGDRATISVDVQTGSSCPVPDQPGVLNFSSRVLNNGDNLTISMSSYPSGNDIYYEWFYPDDVFEADMNLTVGPSITLKVIASGRTIDASEIMVIANSSCESSFPRTGTGTIVTQ